MIVCGFESFPDPELGQNGLTKRLAIKRRRQEILDNVPKRLEAPHDN